MLKAELGGPGGGGSGITGTVDLTNVDVNIHNADVDLSVTIPFELVNPTTNDEKPIVAIGWREKQADGSYTLIAGGGGWAHGTDDLTAGSTKSYKPTIGVWDQVALQPTPKDYQVKIEIGYSSGNYVDTVYFNFSR